MSSSLKHLRRAFAGALSLALAAALSPSSVHAQTPSPAAPPAYAPVHAPNAQAALLRVAAQHKEAQLVGVHLTPPGRTDNVIAACTDLPRIGKPSSEGDLAVMQNGNTVIRRKEKDGVYDVQMPLNDAHGTRIGMIVELVPIQAVPDQAAAVAAAESLRHQYEAAIPSKDWLFREGE